MKIKAAWVLAFVFNLFCLPAANAIVVNVNDDVTITEDQFTIDLAQHILDEHDILFVDITHNGQWVAGGNFRETDGSSHTFTGLPPGPMAVSFDFDDCWLVEDEPGEYDIECNAYNLGNAYVEYEVPYVEPAPSIQSSNEAASLASSISVSQKGALEVDFPIGVPRGINGVQPSLSLSYSDLRQISVTSLPSSLGNGWKLSGFSVIHHCGIESQNYCLNGKQLLEDGDDYRPINSNNTKIIEHTSGGNTWFEMRTGDRILYFGETDNGRFHQNDRDFWLVQEVRDRFNNTMTINYAKSLGMIVLTDINYGGYKVDLLYDFRTAEPSANTGALFLHTIRNTVNGNITGEYRLDHQTQGGISRLKQIQYCGFDQAGTGSTCVPATQLSWFDPPTVDRDFRTGVSQLIDGLGATTNITRLQEANWSNGGDGSTGGSPGYISNHVFDDNELPFNAPTYPPLEHLDDIQAWMVTEIESDNGIGLTNTTQYAYNGHSSQNRTIRTQLPDSTYVYQARHRGDETSYTTNQLTHSYRFSNIATTGTLLSASEWEYTLKILPFATNYYYLQNTKHFIVDDNGAIVGRTEINNTPVWDENSGIITSNTRVTQTGYLSAGQLVPQVTKTVVTTYENDNTNWLVGFSDHRITTLQADGESSESYEVDKTREPGTLNTQSQTYFYGSPKAYTQSVDFDTYGNPTDIELSGSDFDTRATTFSSYLDNRYPQTITQDLSTTGPVLTATSSLQYDARFGSVSIATDPNNLSLETKRDNLGRVYQSIAPTNALQNTDYNRCVVPCGSVQGVSIVFEIASQSRHLNSSILRGTPDTKVSFDKLGRVIRMQSQGFGGEWIKVDSVYNDLGQVAMQSLPYSSGSPQFVKYDYDVHGRLNYQIMPDNTPANDNDNPRTDYTYVQSASGYKVTVIQQIVLNDGGSKTFESRMREESYNSLGQLVESVDAVGTSEQVKTEYDYDSYGNRDWVRVNENNRTIIESEYDNTGNVVEIDDPSAGQCSISTMHWAKSFCKPMLVIFKRTSHTISPVA